jgi:hypothetical protein
LLQGQSFVSFLEDVIGQMDQGPTADLSAWQEVISVMRRHFSLCLRQDPKWRRAADEMWHMARSSVSLLAERSQARRWLAESALSQTLRLATNRLLNARDFPDLGRVLAQMLSRLDVPSCFIALSTSAGYARGALLVRRDQLEFDLAGEFSERHLLPEALREPSRRATWLVQSLVLRERLLGYTVFETGPLDGRIYATLRDALSAAIGGLDAQGH